MKRREAACKGSALREPITNLATPGGVAMARYEYDPYGDGLAVWEDASVAGAGGTRFRFSTKYFDEVEDLYAQRIELYYYGLRSYSPALGRWISRDPLGEEGVAHLYGFGDTLNRIDALGARPFWPWELRAHARCRRAVARFEDAYRSELAHLASKGCYSGPIRCGTCGPDLAFYNSETHIITLGSCPSQDEDDMFDSLAHEVQHAYQHCRNLPLNECTSRICREVEAYFCGTMGGHSAETYNWLMGISSFRDAQLKTACAGAATSATAACCRRSQGDALATWRGREEYARLHCPRPRREDCWQARLPVELTR